MATNKQKALAKKISENIGMPMGQAMKEVGYSEETSKSPQLVTESKGWMELMDKYLPDDDLLQTHKEGLLATKVISAKIIGSSANENTDDFIDVPDYPTRLKAVELGYRVKSKMKDNSVGNQFNTVIINKKQEYDI